MSTNHIAGQIFGIVSGFVVYVVNEVLGIMPSWITETAIAIKLPLMGILTFITNDDLHSISIAVLCSGAGWITVELLRIIFKGLRKMFKKISKAKVWK